MLKAAAVQQPVLKSQRSFNWAPPLLRDTGKLIFDLGQKCQVALGRAAGIIDFPVPANSSLRKTSSRSIRHYYVSGVACYLPIATMSLRQGVRLCEPIRVLDFGCGVGRQLLHFVRHFPAVQYSACDIDRTSIAFIEKNYPQVDSRVNRFEPPLPFAEDSMDMIYSVSTFSHINPDQQGRWLRELRRVVAPGGYCFLTTEGWTAFGMLRDAFGRPGDEAKLRDNGILYREYAFLEGERRRKSLSEQLNPAVGIEGSYGNTVTTPEFIRSNWANYGFEVVDVIEGIIDARQDLVILRRPEASHPSEKYFRDFPRPDGT